MAGTQDSQQDTEVEDSSKLGLNTRAMSAIFMISGHPRRSTTCLS